MVATTMKIGDVEVALVSDGTCWSDGGASFGLVPKPLWERVIAPDARNRIPTALTCLYINDQGTRIVVDTGFGDKLDARARDIWNLHGERRLLTSLACLGIRPEDIDIVILTHLHGDHCGGNTIRRDGRLVAVFPRAEYWIQRRELAEAIYPNERTQATYLAENFIPLLEERRVRIISGDVRVSRHVETMITRGHTHDHQSVVIASDGEMGIFLGDAVARAINLERLAWVPAFDVEPLESMETKRRLARLAVETKALLFFQHDTAIPVGRAEPADAGRVRVVPVREYKGEPIALISPSDGMDRNREEVA